MVTRSTTSPTTSSESHKIPRCVVSDPELSQIVTCDVLEWIITTLSETKSSPLKIGRAPKEKDSNSNHQLPGANLLLVSGRGGGWAIDLKHIHTSQIWIISPLTVTKPLVCKISNIIFESTHHFEAVSDICRRPTMPVDCCHWNGDKFPMVTKDIVIKETDPRWKSNKGHPN